MSHDSRQPATRYVTLGINMTGRRCLVVGGGNVGTRKVLTLLAGDASVTVLAPEISQPLQQAVDAGRLEWLRSEYTADSLKGCVLVVAATDNPALNDRIAADAQSRGILSCNASAADRSQVVFPALLSNEDITVAVHSHGRRCRASQEVRNAIAAWLAGHGHR
jgi:siroheme synthase-like protein